MVLEFKSGDSDVTGWVWCFLFGLNRDIGCDRGEDRVSVRCHSGSKPR
ncbi:hypothetical protein HanRHA438_Chr04g0160021 [Helianthus annuus]|nr:hypothetical protein HanRHA438_Chr04g0160021 [Helianthus annuus]